MHKDFHFLCLGRTLTDLAVMCLYHKLWFGLTLLTMRIHIVIFEHPSCHVPGRRVMARLAYWLLQLALYIEEKNYRNTATHASCNGFNQCVE